MQMGVELFIPLIFLVAGLGVVAMIGRLTWKPNEDALPDPRISMRTRSSRSRRMWVRRKTAPGFKHFV